MFAEEKETIHCLIHLYIIIYPKLYWAFATFRTTGLGKPIANHRLLSHLFHFIGLVMRAFLFPCKWFFFLMQQITACLHETNAIETVACKQYVFNINSTQSPTSTRDNPNMKRQNKICRIEDGQLREEEQTHECFIKKLQQIKDHPAQGVYRFGDMVILAFVASD